MWGGEDDLAPTDVSLSRRLSRKASQVIAADLRRRIVRGELQPGQMLPPEPDMLRVFQVSRETLREALGVLESETLIEVKRGRNGGTVVRQPDIEAAARYVSMLLQIGGTTIGDVIEARDVIVRPALRMLAEFPAPGAVEQLDAICASEASAAEDPVALVERLCAFEQVAAALTGTKTLATLVGVLGDVYGSVLHVLLTGPHGPDLAAALMRRHRRFVACLRALDVDGCQEAWSGCVADSFAAAVDGVGRAAVVDVVPRWLEASERRPGRVSSRVVLDIRARIARGELTSGDRLATLAELEVEIGVSRPTLREALRILETDGLVSLRAGSRSGATIQHPAEEVAARLAGIVLESEQVTLADVWQARILFEPSVMALSAERMLPDELGELRRKQADWPWKVSDPVAWAVEAMGFRFRVLRASRNPALLIVVSIIRRIAGGSTRAVTSMPHSSWEQQVHRDSERTFGALLDALEQGAGADAAGIWESYLRRTVPFLYQQLGDRLIVDLVDD